jgi:hypothetical protein
MFIEKETSYVDAQEAAKMLGVNNPNPKERKSPWITPQTRFPYTSS